MSERRSCLLLPPRLSGLRERSEPTAPHATIAPQTQVPSDRPGPTPKLSSSPRDSGPHLGRGAPTRQELTWEQDGREIRAPARESARTMQGCHPNRDLIAFPAVFQGPHRLPAAFPRVPVSRPLTRSNSHSVTHVHTTHTPSRSHAFTLASAHNSYTLTHRLTRIHSHTGAHLS